jgi:hypothetical protein
VSNAIVHAARVQGGLYSNSPRGGSYSPRLNMATNKDHSGPALFSSYDKCVRGLLFLKAILVWRCGSTSSSMAVMTSSQTT